MKSWTVMLVPNDQGSTRTLNLSSGHFWTVLIGFWAGVVLLAALGFVSAFFYSRNAHYQEHAAETKSHLRQALRELEQARYAQAPAQESAAPRSADSHMQAEFERRLREQLKKRDEALQAELIELYEIETQMRQRHRIPPRKSAHGYVALAGEGGQGGPPDSVLQGANEAVERITHPPALIYGLAQPSADLMVQEINLRTASLTELLEAMDSRADQVARTPSSWPVEHRKLRITSNYGRRVDPFDHHMAHHAGIDLAAPFGTPVVATARGKVVEAGYSGHYGNLVKVDHGNGIETLYAHLNRCRAKEGDLVEPGDVIGDLGRTGRATGPHVHYEVRENGKAVNPEPYIGK
jgi:murein DD-endopeptidase MepM/ murein hydrolase activator NlpD